MKRRQLLKKGAVLGSIGFAGYTTGCIGGVPGLGGGETQMSDEPDISIDRRECGNPDEDSTSVNWEDSRVVISGTIVGNDGCKTARVSRVAYDPDSDKLDITVKTDDGGGSNCTQCITVIDYEVRIEFENGVADSVTVRHQGVKESSQSFER